VSNVGFQYPISQQPHLIESLKIGIVTSVWNSEITSKLKSGAVERLIASGIKDQNIFTLSVPGALELPLGATKLFDARQLDGVLCLGCVIKGDTPHFDFVCQGATEGIMRVGLDFKKPCVFGLITTFTEEQAWDRTGGQHGHKGMEAADTALQQIIEYQSL
jgi:6,7-dimethyl-8-ribityllumazine synthase